VNPVARGQIATSDEAGPVTIRTLDADQKVTAEYRVGVKPFSDLPEGDQEALCDVVLAVDPATATIELDVNGQLADTYRLSEEPPAMGNVRVEAAPLTRGQAPGVELTWGVEGVSAHYNVQMSDDRGRTWRTLAVGLREPRVSIHPDNLPADGSVLFRVIATDGLRASETTIEWSPGQGQTPS
jgi:hypothetical protein